MTPAECVPYELDSALFKLRKVFEGISESDLDRKISPKAMTARETAAHLDECYQCVLVESAGGKYEWGTHQPSTMAWPGLYEEMMAKRAAATEACLKEGDEGLERAIDYIVSHDNYHVGQLCLIRIEGDENWNPYCIYNI